jgi:hypothetical protein
MTQKFHHLAHVLRLARLAPKGKVVAKNNTATPDHRWALPQAVLAARQPGFVPRANEIIAVMAFLDYRACSKSARPNPRAWPA